MPTNQFPARRERLAGAVATHHVSSSPVRAPQSLLPVPADQNCDPPHSVGPDLKLTFPPKPGGNEGCKTKWGSIEVTTTSFAVSTNPTTTQTVSSTVMSTSLSYPGCEATDSATATSGTSTVACTLEPTVAPNNRRQLQQPPNAPSIDFSCEKASDDTYIIWVKEEARKSSAVDIRNLLERRRQQNQRDFEEVNGTTSTYLFFAYNMHAEVARVMEKQPAVWGKVEKEDRKRVREDDDFVSLDTFSSFGSMRQGKRQIPELDNNRSSTPPSPAKSRRSWRSRLSPRALDTRTSARTWELSQLSVPGGVNWNPPSEPGERTDYRIWEDDDTDAGTQEYIAYWDDSYGEGQLIYIFDEGVLESHNVRLISYPT